MARSLRFSASEYGCRHGLASVRQAHAPLRETELWVGFSLAWVKESRHLSKLGKKGGKARLETMTEDQRKESARKAAQARWAKHNKPTSTK
jgi:hypothetical protein